MKPSQRMFIGFFLITDISIIMYPHFAQSVHHTIQKKQSNEFHQKINQLEPKHITTQVEKVNQCNDAIYKNEDNVHDSFTEGYNRDEYQACIDAPELGEHLATIELPTLDLEIPVYIGANQAILAQGIGQVDGSSLPIGGLNTHTVLAGHRGMGMKAMFRDLDELQIGDTFYINTLEGKLRYDVYDVEVILPHETNNLFIEEGKDLASLITCHPYRANSHRLVVHVERTK